MKISGLILLLRDKVIADPTLLDCDLMFRGWTGAFESDVEMSRGTHLLNKNTLYLDGTYARTHITPEGHDPQDVSSASTNPTQTRT